MIELHNGDCLELMKDIPSGSVDMILCDLPYGTVKGLHIDGWKNKTRDWDNTINTELLFKEYERVLRCNGVAILFSQEPYTSHLRTFECENFEFLYPLIWKKNHFANCLSCNKAPVSYFEDLSVFSKKYDKQNLHPLREYFKNVLDFLKMNKKQVIDILGTKVDHCLRFNSSQFALCTNEVYNELIDKLHIDKMKGFKTYRELEELNKTFKRTFKRTFNLQDNSKIMSNVLEFKKEYKRYHPTQKPVELLEYLIKTYTNENDLVLDNCMGSGSTGVACKNLNRNFIGIELDKNYFEIAQNRIKC